MTSALSSQPTTKQASLTPVQRLVFDGLLEIGAERPTAPDGLVGELEAIIESGTRLAIERWVGDRMWVSKSLVSSMLKCEQMTISQREQPFGGMIAPTAVGIVTHRAIQMASTHPHMNPADWIDASVEASMAEEKFADFWLGSDLGTQSDLVTQMQSRLLGFLDSFPPLERSWVPRFEESMAPKVAGFTLGARADLTLGRPRSDGRQSTFLCDFKTGALRDEHYDEAMFYALVATLKYRIPPFRSTVFSLSSNEWTDPDVTDVRLLESADRLVRAVNAYSEVMTSQREADRVGGIYCRWCPERETCPAAVLDGPGA